MRNPADLTHSKLAEIVRRIQEILYFDPDAGCLNRDREWSGADVCQEVAATLDAYDLVPDSNLSGCG